ncbi:MAG: HAD hydrolase-like protein [Armatimonadota bacterium]
MKNPNKIFIKSVLFDLDGTLVDTNIDFDLMRNEIFIKSEEYGVEKNLLKGLDILAMIEKAFEIINIANDKKTADKYYNEIYQILENIEIKHAKNTKPIHYSSELFASLKKYGIKIGIITRNCKKASRISLEIAGLEPDITIAREDCKIHKPNPNPILMALDLFNTKSDFSIMIGDHPMDIMSGKSAGVKTIGFLRDNKPNNYFDEINPDYIISSLEEVLDVIVNCNS